MAIKAHFDGKVIVPDEPVDLPVGEPIELDWRVPLTTARLQDPAARRKALEEFFGLAVPGGNIPDEALSREYMYEDRV